VLFCLLEGAMSRKRSSGFEPLPPALEGMDRRERARLAGKAWTEELARRAQAARDGSQDVLTPAQFEQAVRRARS